MIANSSSIRGTKAFCVGQAKSGTASVYGLLAAHHRAAHEPERAALLEMILRESRGELAENDFGAYLLERDQRLNLDYDIAWANQFIIDHLLVAFPDAKFIVLIRDPYTWLQSTVGHLISREIPPDVRAFMDWWFEPDRFPHTHHDAKLKERGAYSVGSFLNAWNQHVNVCSRVIPPEKRLILRTHELNLSHQQLADFLQISKDSLDAQHGHLNRSTCPEEMHALWARGHLNQMVAMMCSDNMARYFPEVTGMENVDALWDPVVATD